MQDARVTPQPSPNVPLVVAIEMGYGHLRPAHALADALGTAVLQVDRPPLADPNERRLWDRTRAWYEAISRVSQLPFLGPPLEWALDELTKIPHLFPTRDLSPPTAATRAFHSRAKSGELGRGLAERLRTTGQALLATHFAPALAAEAAGLDKVFCLVTDSDCNRIWAPLDGRKSRIVYLAPTERVVRRLQAYGVSSERIELTGFPLPPELLGGPSLDVLRRNLAARLVRLDPRHTFRGNYKEELEQFLGPLPAEEEGKPPLITFAVGGAGAQAELVRGFLPGFRPMLESGRLRLALVAGVRPEVAERFRQYAREARVDGLLGGAIRVLLEPDIPGYFRAFNALLAETDVLWTKPSELTFFGALGLALVLSKPVGAQERYNRRWAIERGAALKQRKIPVVAERVEEWLADGTLARVAWSGFMTLPKFGTFRILDRLGKA